MKKVTSKSFWVTILICVVLFFTLNTVWAANFCGSCGAKLTDGVKFCSECGAKSSAKVGSDKRTEEVVENNAGNLMLNPGFEEAGEEELPKAWNILKSGATEGAVEWASDFVHSGKKSAKVNVISYAPPKAGKYSSASWSSKEVDAPPANTKLKVSGWIKTNNIVAGEQAFYKLRFSFYVLDEAKKNIVKHWDIACIDGSFDWQKFESEVKIPEGARYIKIGCILTSCTGTAWFDDIEIRIAE